MWSFPWGQKKTSEGHVRTCSLGDIPKDSEVTHYFLFLHPGYFVRAPQPMNFGLLSRDIIEGLSDSFCGQLLELVCFPTVRAVVCVHVSTLLAQLKKLQREYHKGSEVLLWGFALALVCQGEIICCRRSLYCLRKRTWGQAEWVGWKSSKSREVSSPLDVGRWSFLWLSWLRLLPHEGPRHWCHIPACKGWEAEHYTPPCTSQASPPGNECFPFFMISPSVSH